MTTIPEEFQALLEDDTKAFAFLATIMDDGTPQVTPVWFDVEDGYILVNSAKGRVKDRNMRARPHVALTIIDLSKPYRYLQVRGTVVEITEEGAAAHINRLSHKYRGRDYDLPPEQMRVIYKIKPESVDTKD
jgi:PPOX class probable F420-dependent enzyme